MKPLKCQFMMVLSLWLTMLCITGQAQSKDQKTSALIEEKSFELATYMGANQTVNLVLMVNQAAGVTLIIKDADDKPLHEFYMKKMPKVYRYKLNFADSQSGLYKLEISDGRKTIIRRIEVVDVPAIEVQRYVTFSSPFTP